MKTGRYLWVSGKGFVKISDSPPNTQVFDVHVPEGGYWSGNLGRFVSSRSEKRQLLAAEGLVEKQSNLTRREI